MSSQEHEIANLFLKKAPQLQTLVLWQRDRVLDYMTDHMKNQSTMTIRTVWPGGFCRHITANPDNVEYILKTNFENYPKGIIVRRHLSDLLGEGIFNANGDEWKVQRKVASHEFTSKSLRNFMHGTIQAELNHRLVPLLAKICNEGASIDLQDLFMRFAFDSICKLGFGVDPACLDFSLPNVKFAQAFDIATSLTSARLRSFPFILRLQRALNVGNERRIREAVRQIDDFAISVIQTRRKQLMEIASGRTTLESLEDQHMDLLSRFMGLPAQEKERSVEHGDKNQKQEAFSDRFLRDIVISFILAGRDTTSAGLSWFFWLLSCNHHVEGTIRAEIAKIVKFRVHVDSKEGRDNPGTSFTYEELKQMHYLHAAVTESLRLYPPVPLDGPRVCLGKDFAMLQMKLVAAGLLTQFTFSVPENFKPTYALSLTMPIKNGLPVRVHPLTYRHDL
ncbi:hypothetical protein CY35_03G035300 [Sphagnum magellanicum]|nr:hypothetical protein CY35_03G035300 [Sphagnum magellanicum]KAH9567615.1 hypothetical protein CY35_03G035300 [Sphagnum magellanicum]